MGFHKTLLIAIAASAGLSPATLTFPAPSTGISPASVTRGVASISGVLASVCGPYHRS